MFVDKRIQIQTDRYGLISLRGVTLADVKELERLTQLELEPREFTARVVHHQFIEPFINFEEVHDWPDELLRHIAVLWAENDKGLQKTLPNEALLFVTFKEAVIAYVTERNARREATTRRIAEAQANIDIPNFGFDLPSIFRSIETGNRMLNDIRSSMSWLDNIYQAQNWIDNITPRIELPDFSWLNDISERMSLFDLRQNFISTNIFSNNELTPFLDSILEGANRLAQVTDTVNSSIERISSLFTPIDNIGELFSTLPDLTEFIRQQAELAQAESNWEESGYAFASHLWSTTFQISFAKLKPEVRGAVATNKLLAQTRRKEFQSELGSIIQGSSVLKRRWSIIAEALAAHQQRNYIVSVPMFLTQLEGIIADALILRGSVFRVGKKLYAKGPDGRPKKDRKNKNIEVKGLGQLVNHSDYHNHAALHLSVDLLVNHLVSERNAILHGRRTSYGTAKLSTQTLLLLFIFAQEVAAFEQGQSQP